MPTRDTPFPAGTPSWVDLFSSDTARAAEFYGAVLGWTFEPGPPEFGGYGNFTSDGHQVAGMMHNSGEAGTPDTWTVYVTVDDAEATAAVAEKAGATVVAPAMAVGDLGSMAVLVDPAGAAFGLWQPGRHIGYTKHDEPGSPSWEELLTRDFASATSFYREVFGWQLEPVSDTDDFRYFTAKVGDTEVAGLMDGGRLPADQAPSHWAVYFRVDDVDAAVVEVERLGGTVVEAPQDTPYGRLATVADPTGAAFKLHG
ncbi:VOC family protein [Solicola sp. PLA-1-18]|uniref:VOC family protein n=1 Tax=Solicola sp. PLA-1-18 TaxID=3380532 RepID=UPI003B7CA37E